MKLFLQELRRADLYKPPGVAETLDWAAALQAMDSQALDEQAIRDTLGVVLKYQDDVQLAHSQLARRLAAAAHERA